MRIVGPRVRHLLEVGGKETQHQEQIGIGRRGRDPESCSRRPNDVALLGKWLGDEGEPVTRCFVADGRRRRNGLIGAQRAIGMQVKLDPPGIFERPLLVTARFKWRTGAAHQQMHARTVVPAVVLILQEMAEELFLEGDAGVRVVLGPVLIAVEVEPLLISARFNEALHIAAQVQALSAPVGRRQQRHIDLAEIRQTRAPIGFIREAVFADLAPPVHQVG